jgi:tRNA pseudouridine13 synthase
MRIKQRPEDFSVKESYRFDTVADGPFRVYLMDKQKLSTFDAIARLQERFGLKPGSISYCGLKDKQGRTEQLIAVKGFDVDMQEPDLRLKFLGRTNKALTAANTTSNRFAVTVRQVDDKDLNLVTLAAVEVNRLGVVNYFDSQRFGSLKHGQGFIAKDLIRGDFEAALHNYLGKPSPLDRTDDAKVKAFWAANWGNWDERCPYDAGKKYFRIIRCLRSDPTDFVNAFLQIDSDYRALLLFTYQSYLWNEAARRLMQLVLPREALFPMPYQAGTLLHHRDAGQDVLAYLRKATVPLLAPDTTFHDAKVEEAVKWVLGKEKLTLEQLRIEENPRFLYFKHEERPLLVHPGKLVVGKARPDEMNKGFTKVNIAFTLPPGSYATLVVKRLFHFGVEKEKLADVEPIIESAPRWKKDNKTGKPVRPIRAQGKAEPVQPTEVEPPRPPRASHPPRGTKPVTQVKGRTPFEYKPPEKQGFLARQRDKKKTRADNIRSAK